VYQNICPHRSVTLNVPSSNQIFDRHSGVITCLRHKAHFRLRDGKCTLGPCKGKKLKSIPSKIINDRIIIELKKSKIGFLEIVQ